MTSLDNFKTAMETRWEALTPTVDNSGITAYNFIDDFVDERGGGMHRKMVWRLSEDTEIVGEHPIQLQSIIRAELFIDRTVGGAVRTYEAFVQAVHNEARALAVNYSGLNALGSGVYEAGLVGWTVEEDEPERPARAGGFPTTQFARVFFTFNVLTEET